MAHQVAIKPCDICTRATALNFCVDCEQFFCEDCSSLHLRQKVSRRHQFKDSSEVIQEVKSICPQHNQSFILFCTECDVLICPKCISKNHHGHKVSEIDDFVTDLKNDLQKRIDAKIPRLSNIMKDFETGSNTFARDEDCVVKMLQNEAKHLKEMVDAYIGEMIATIKHKCKAEREKLEQIFNEAKKNADKGRVLEQKKNDIHGDRHHDNLVKELKVLRGEVDKLAVPELPTFPTIAFQPKNATKDDIGTLVGNYRFGEMENKKSSGDQTFREMENKKSSGDQTFRNPLPTEQHGYFYKCVKCGYERVFPDRPYWIFCRKCGERMKYVKDV